MRILIASWVALAACSEDPRVEVTLDLPSDAPPIEGKSVRVIIGEEDNLGFFDTIAGTGGEAGPESWEIPVREAKEGVRARALIYEGDASPTNPFRDDLVSPRPHIGRDGCIEPYDGPGLGIEVDESLFAKYPGIPGPCYL